MIDEATRKEVLRDQSDDEIIAAITDKRYTYYAILTELRVGGLALLSLIEYHYFHPQFGPSPNDQFRVMRKRWQDMEFVVFGVPRAYEFKVRDMARKIAMRVADGVPAVIVGGKTVVNVSDRSNRDAPRLSREGLPMRFFPGALEAERVRQNFYNIENDHGSVVYRNRHDLNEKVRERESKIMDVLMLFGRKVTPEQVRDYVWFGQNPGDMIKPETKQ